MANLGESHNIHFSIQNASNVANSKKLNNQVFLDLTPHLM